MWRSVLALTALPLLSCTPKEAPNAVCGTGSLEKQSMVVTELHFELENEDGSSLGFDLDNDITVAGGAAGCGVADGMHEDGTEGIDNSFARLWPLLLIASPELVATDGLLNSFISDGELLFMMQVSGLDDMSNDDCVDLEFLRGDGTPYVGAQGQILENQTFSRNDDEMDPLYGPGVELSDGVIRTGALGTVEVPMIIFTFPVTLRMDDAHLHVQLNEDGTVEGYLSGAIDYMQLLNDATGTNVDQAVVEAGLSLIDNFADLSPNAEGTCERVSGTLTFKGKPAYLNALAE